MGDSSKTVYNGEFSFTLQNEMEAMCNLNEEIHKSGAAILDKTDAKGKGHSDFDTTDKGAPPSNAVGEKNVSITSSKKHESSAKERKVALIKKQREQNLEKLKQRQELEKRRRVERKAEELEKQQREEEVKQRKQELEKNKEKEDIITNDFNEVKIDDEDVTTKDITNKSSAVSGKEDDLKEKPDKPTTSFEMSTKTIWMIVCISVVSSILVVWSGVFHIFASDQEK